MKKIIIGLVVVGLVLALIIGWMLQGNAKSEVVKQVIATTTEKVESEKGVEINDMSELSGKSFVSDLVSKPKSSEIMFSIQGLKDAQGRFNEFEIVLSMVDAIASLEVVIAAKSVYTANNMRDQSLLEEDFLNVGEYPEVTFVSNEVVMGDTSYIAKGELNMLGVTGVVEIPFKFVGADHFDDGRHFAAFEGGFSFDRTKFGMAEDDAIGNDIQIKFYTELLEQE